MSAEFGAVCTTYIRPTRMRGAYTFQKKDTAPLLGKTCELNNDTIKLVYFRELAALQKLNPEYIEGEKIKTLPQDLAKSYPILSTYSLNSVGALRLIKYKP
jgi:hypothetical protein